MWLCSCRLQNLESSQTAIASELDRVKTLGSSIEGWKLQVNNANNQAATALDLVKCNGADMR